MSSESPDAQAGVPEPLDSDVPDWDGDVGDAAPSREPASAAPQEEADGSRLPAASLLVLLVVVVVIGAFLAWAVAARGPRVTPGQREAEPARPAPAGPPPAELAEGAALFAANCAECHGDRGDGGEGPSLRARRLGPTRLDDGVLVGFIGNGGGAMEGFGDRLDAAQLAAIVRYMRWLQGYGPGTAPPEADE